MKTIFSHYYVCDRPTQCKQIMHTDLMGNTNISCMSYACYGKLKGPSSLKTVPAMSVHSATGHVLCLIGLTCVKLQQASLNLNILLLCVLGKELTTGLEMQNLHHLGCA